jgi:4-amino-4-deoxy-L-arabinose transferase-like glycosyltransferase
MTANSNEGLSTASTRRLLLALGGIWLCLFLIALTGYPNLMDNDLRVPSNVLAAIQNGHWAIQRDVDGDVAAKPPLLTWLIALVTLAEGHLSPFGIYLPSALATLGAAWAIFFVGRKQFGWQAGFVGALIYLLSPAADRQMTTARYDGLFTFPVFLAALAAFRAWQLGRGWTWFWLAAAAATMVKGPLGLVLGGAGLAAAFWEWRSGTPLKPRGNHLPGIVIYLVICGGWFALAYRDLGQALIDKMIFRELVQHSVTEGGGLGSGFYQPTLSLLTHFLPWSPLLALAAWRIWKHPASTPEARRFERFLVCWLVIGLVLFSLSPHQRGRLVYPLLPAVALLAGRELQRLLQRLSPRQFGALVTSVAVLTLVGLGIYHHVLLRTAKHSVETLALKSLADDVRSTVGAQFPLTHVDCPYALQFYLETWRPWVTPEQAADLLRGDAAAFLVVVNLEKVKEQLGTNAPPVYELWTRKLNDRETVHLVSNHPKLEWAGNMAMILGPLSLHMEGVKLIQAKEHEFVIERDSKAASAFTVTNHSNRTEEIRVRVANDAAGTVLKRALAPGESWRI